MKTLTLLAAGYDHPDLAEQKKIEEADRGPRQSLYGYTLNSTLLNERYMTTVPGLRRALYAPLPVWMAQVLEAFVRRKKYDAILSWDARLGLAFAALMKLTGARVPHMVMFSWISRPKKAMVLRFVHSHIDRMFVWSSFQRDFLLERMRIPPRKVVFCSGRVDQKFFRPMQRETDMICSVGREMRDYVTLIRAIRDLDIPCHIAVSVIPGVKDAWITEIEREGALPPHITVGNKNYADLRDLYARSKFVVTPLLPTDTDNGITSLLEAMAMGKAVICTKTEGQRDIVTDGVNGILVPPFDAAALRRAIDRLLEHPEEAARMGKAGRELVERSHNLDLFVERVRSSTEEAIAGFRRDPGRPVTEKLKNSPSP
jgi:glycosyltransferase involved in cell wall biosynthesis